MLTHMKAWITESLNYSPFWRRFSLCFSAQQQQVMNIHLSCWHSWSVQQIFIINQYVDVNIIVRAARHNKMFALHVSENHRYGCFFILLYIIYQINISTLCVITRFMLCIWPHFLVGRWRGLRWHQNQLLQGKTWYFPNSNQVNLNLIRP